ncbi:hypothetical protein A2V80_03110 [Candidatus Woesebacteria bacterium RBG_16_39_8b]|uniref:Glycosyl transferase family 1 domain-containing protein n=1 Tax=Candidatus Woesebacteria bacterium RBG_16_39_8b TaxID=1802482 RepID=A0A1F7XDZ3_9BACT|nr:MAG: hypothetical protein A2V80_03110 [Candidatus Woesebacteria bacterium RBG_16_39_8b]
MNFSDSFKSVGKVKLKKIFHVFELICRIWMARIKFKPEVIYYPPAGPDLIPILRDIPILLLTRPLFSKTVFHFRAAGISEYLSKAPFWLRSIARYAYGKPDVAIQLSRLNPCDGEYFSSKKIFIIPNGLEDEALPLLPIHRETRQLVRILFVGILRKDKGVMTLLRAARLLARERSDIKITFIGQFKSVAFEKEAKSYVALNHLGLVVEFVGEKVDKEKWEIFKNSDIFCFPSYFNSESFGNVLLEAMMFELPIVATLWRGIPDIVKEDIGILIPIKADLLLHDAIRGLIENPIRRVEMGRKARKRYLENYTLGKHLVIMEEVLSEV